MEIPLRDRDETKPDEFVISGDHVTHFLHGLGTIDQPYETTLDVTQEMALYDAHLIAKEKTAENESIADPVIYYNLGHYTVGTNRHLELFFSSEVTDTVFRDQVIKASERVKKSLGRELGEKEMEAWQAELKENIYNDKKPFNKLIAWLSSRVS